MDRVRGTASRDALASQLELLLGERDTRDARAVFTGRHQREAAPAAADLEHTVAGAQTGLLADRPPLPLLGPLERVPFLPQGAGVGHRLVEESRYRSLPR